MRYRKFGKTDLTASEIGFGVWTMTAGWWGEYTDEQAVSLLHQAFDRGITFFDTADTYGNGRGETIVAKAFADRRSKVVIATKGGYDFYNHGGERRGQRELPQDWSPSFIRMAVEESLKRLQTDHIDLYQLHNAKMDAIESDALFEELERLVQAGKLRHYAVALGPAIGWRDEGIRAMNERNLTAMQIIYNMLEQDPGREFFPLARERGVGIMVRVPHSSGMLEGKYTLETKFEKHDHRNHRPREWLVDGLKKLEQLKFLIDGRGRTIGQAALRFVLAEPSITVALPNIYNAEQLVEFAGASDVPDLTREELGRIAELYADNFGLAPVAG